MVYFHSMILCLAAFAVDYSSSQGFHFNRFSGPVSGPITRVDVPRHNHPGGPSHGPSIDYVAKPDYSFAYGVEDPLTGNYQNQKEVRDGDVVKGEYSVVDADGITRRVTYTADPRNGFQATVHMSEPNPEHANQQARFANSLQQQYPQQQQYNQPQQQYPQQQHYTQSQQQQQGYYDDDY